MPRLRYLLAAQRDLVDIVEHILRRGGSAGVARNFQASLREQCRHLASLPGTLGTPRPELGEGMRSFPCRGYIIFFRYAKGELQIIDILEGHRDVDAFFGHDGSTSMDVIDDS